MIQTLIPANAYLAQYIATGRISTIERATAKQNDFNFLKVYCYWNPAKILYLHCIDLDVNDHACMMTMKYPVYLNLYIHTFLTLFQQTQAVWINIAWLCSFLRRRLATSYNLFFMSLQYYINKHNFVDVDMLFEYWRRCAAVSFRSWLHQLIFYL